MYGSRSLFVPTERLEEQLSHIRQHFHQCPYGLVVLRELQQLLPHDAASLQVTPIHLLGVHPPNPYPMNN
jgi:hypothetical protein